MIDNMIPEFVMDIIRSTDVCEGSGLWDSIFKVIRVEAVKEWVNSDINKNLSLLTKAIDKEVG